MVRGWEGMGWCGDGMGGGARMQLFRHLCMGHHSFSFFARAVDVLRASAAMKAPRGSLALRAELLGRGSAVGVMGESSQRWLPLEAVAPLLALGIQAGFAASHLPVCG